MVSSVEEVVEAVQARVGTGSEFALSAVDADEILATVVQRRGRTLLVGGRRALLLLWLTFEMRVSSIRGK